MRILMADLYRSFLLGGEEIRSFTSSFNISSNVGLWGDSYVRHHEFSYQVFLC